MAVAYYNYIRRRNPNLHRERIFRDIDNPLDYLDDTDIICKYRLPRHNIIDLCGRFNRDLRRPTLRSRPLPVSLQVMVALRFYATGSFQAILGDVHRISRPSVSRIINDFTDCLVRLSPEYVKMPTQNDSVQIMRGFSDIAGFPNVIGAIDGTHIRIKSPSLDEHLYVNRKNYHSINVQAVCDSKLRFMNIVAKWPGSTHDSFILENSALKDMFERGAIPEGWLLGDSGYPLRPWLLTPVLNPTTRPEERYNASHIRTRNTVERSFGVLKSRFRCLDTSGGSLFYSPTKACRVTVAVAVLHNMCINNGVPIPADCVDARDRGRIGRPQYIGPINDGVTVRNSLINGRFA